MADTRPAQPIYFPFDEDDATDEDEFPASTDGLLVFDEEGNALPNEDRPTPVTG